MSLIKIALLYGGKSGEHEISLISGASVLHNLNPKQYQIIPIGMDKDGKFYVNDFYELLNYKDALPIKGEKAFLLAGLLKDGKFALDVDVVFPVAHGPLYEDGSLQGILRLANVPYVGCDVLSSAIGMDKDITRRLLKNINGLKSACYCVIPWSLNEQQIESYCLNKLDYLGGWPLFVKPCSLGSSVGIHKVHNIEELVNAVKDARSYENEVLIEQFINGREIEVAVLENINLPLLPRVSLPGEIKINHKDGFYSYMAKYLESDTTDLLVPANLDDNIILKLQNLASEIFINLKCSGMSRVDFFVNDENIYFNEINTMPGFTTFSMYPKLWQKSGIKYSQLLDQLINIGIARHKRIENLVTHYQ